MSETIREKLNRIDHKCLDENLRFHDLRSLFEATAPRLSPQDKEEIKKVIQNTDDAETIAAVLQAKAMDDKNESLEEELVDAPQEVIDELLEILENHGFILDSTFEENPGKTMIMGDVHIQVINPDSFIEDSGEIDVQDELSKYVTQDLIDEIHELDQESNCPITWNFGINNDGQVTGGLDIMKQWVEESLQERVNPRVKGYFEPAYDKRYSVRAYYDDNYRGLADSFSSDDFDEIRDKAHEYLSDGSYIIVNDYETGKFFKLTPDEYFYGFEGEGIQPYMFDESLNEAMVNRSKFNLLEKAPSAIKGKNSSKTVTSDNYVNEIGDPFTFTSSTKYGEFSGNGYIMDKQGNEYPVKTSSYDSDAGRIAGGKTNYYVTILYKGTPLKWSGYRAVFNTSHNEDIISDLKDGYYLEDYCARHPDVDSAGRDIVRKLASQGDPDALSYKQLGINKVKDKESKAFSPIDLRSYSYDAKIDNGTITPNSSEGDVATLLKAPNFISQVKSILNVNGYSINDFNGAIIRGAIKPAGESSYQRKLSIDNKTGDVSFRVPISKHKKNSNKLGSLEVSDSDIKGYDSVDVIVTISTIDLRNCDFINQLTKVIKKYRRSERATAIKNNAARIFNNKRSFQFGDIKQDKIDSRDEATRDYDNRTSDMLAGKWLDFNDFKRFIEAIPAKELDKAEQEVSNNNESLKEDTVKNSNSFSLRESNTKFAYAVRPRKLDLDLYDIVFIDNNKRASSKRFENEKDCFEFIKKNAKKNNWIVDRKEELKNKKDKLTSFGKKILDANNLDEDTIKQNGKWVNKGKEGTHGKFRTKKQADAQRKAMFANGYKGESLNEAYEAPYFKAYITNLGKYNEGELVGDWVEFPIDEDDFTQVLESIGIGDTDDFGAPYEEWFVSDYDCNLPGFDWQELGEYPSYESLQEYGELVNSIDDLEAVSNALEVTGNLQDAIDGIDNGSIMFYRGVNDNSDLGYMWVDEVYGGAENLDKDTLERYFDYEQLGRDLSFDSYENDEGEDISAGEYWCGDENASDAEIGEAFVDEVGIDGVSDISSYFDYEQFGRDLSFNGFTFTSDGCVLQESLKKNGKLLKEDYQHKDDEWGSPYTYKEVERELKSITNDFTDEDGNIRCYWEQEKEYGKQILKDYYEIVEVSDGRTGSGEDMSWVISYARPKEN